MTITVTPVTRTTSASPPQATCTTASFTPTNGEILVACFSSDNTAGSAITISDSLGGTWTLRGRHDGTVAPIIGMMAAVYTRPVTATSAMTVTASNTGSFQVSLKVYRVAGNGVAFGASGTGGSTTANVTPTAFTSTVNNSYMFMHASTMNASAAPTSSDLTIDAQITTGDDMAVISGYKSLGAPGSQTFNMNTNASPVSWHWVAIEITENGDATATPPAQTMSATKPTPTITASATATPATDTVSATIPTPTITRTATVPAAAIAKSATVNTPTVNTSGNVTISATTIAKVATVFTPTIFLPDARPLPATKTMSKTMAAPTITATATVAVGTKTMSVTMFLPTVQMIEFGDIPLYRVETRLRNGTYVSDMPYRNLQFELGWNKPYGIRFEVPMDHPLVTPATLEAGLHEVWVWRNGVVVAAGPLWDAVASSESRSISCGAMSLLDYLDVRLIDNVEYDVVAQTTIAWDLIDNSQALTDGNLNIIPGTLSGGITRSAKWIDYDNKYILEALQDFSEMDQGFDFYIDPMTRAFTAIYPRPQRDIGLQLTYPNQIRRYSLQIMGKWARNRVRVTGQDPNYATAVDTSSRSYYGLRDYADSYRDAATVTDLTAFASKLRDKRALPKRYPTCVIDVTDINIFNTNIIKYGDVIRVLINDGFVQFDQDMRYITAQVSVDKQGMETVVLYLQDTRELE